MTDKKASGSATLKDVATAAGVSLATASRVLSNSDYPVSNELRKKILNAANALHYTPNMLARVLKSNVYRVIGVIVPTLQNPFFNQVILGIESVANRCGYEIMIFSSHRSIEQERNNINSLLQSRVMAMIIISIDTDRSTLQNYISYGGKVAMLEADFKLSNAIVTETDHFGAGRLAVEHLVENGHKRIAFLTAPLTKTYRRAILQGIMDTMKEYGLRFGEEDIFKASGEEETENGLYEFELGKELVEMFIGRRKDYSAIIAVNDLTAFGIIQALTQYGISVPEDISVISFDNIVYSEMISPPLTTVELPSSNMGSTICTMLISSLTNSDQDLTDVVFRFQGHLVERRSVARYRK